MFLTDAAYIRRWLDEEYESKEFAEGAPEIFTEKGERVRSKNIPGTKNVRCTFSR